MSIRHRSNGFEKELGEFNIKSHVFYEKLQNIRRLNEVSLISDKIILVSLYLYGGDSNVIFMFFYRCFIDCVFIQQTTQHKTSQNALFANV